MLLAAVVLAGCFAPADLPPRKADIAGPAPQLMPLSELRAVTTDRSDLEQISAQTLARAQGLRARAAKLRGPVLGQQARAELTGSARAQR